MAYPGSTEDPSQVVPSFSFSWDSSVDSWNVSAKEWLRINQKSWNALIASALVFDGQNRVLLVQRAANDTCPHRWEPPGGAVEKKDATVLAGCARELWEETGLQAIHARRCVPVRDEGREWEQPGMPMLGSQNRIFFQFTFEVVVAGLEGDGEGHIAVQLDPREHQAFVWATEEEVRAGRVGERDIRWTTKLVKNVLLEGFRLRVEDGGSDWAAARLERNGNSANGD
ncbi:hypothetical protein HJFPF1_06988 [Paramyrothecium foliicola]|nr:hypothetical protein HJFPF1_06988 [Paramyrothecium foliicola]